MDGGRFFGNSNRGFGKGDIGSGDFVVGFTCFEEGEF